MVCGLENATAFSLSIASRVEQDLSECEARLLRLMRQQENRLSLTEEMTRWLDALPAGEAGTSMEDLCEKARADGLAWVNAPLMGRAAAKSSRWELWRRGESPRLRVLRLRRRI